LQRTALTTPRQKEAEAKKAAEEAARKEKEAAEAKRKQEEEAARIKAQVRLTLPVEKAMHGLVL
jgi:hypothetical protein